MSRCYNCMKEYQGLSLIHIYSREGCYIYVKEVDMGQTEIVLGNEEQEALEQAMGYVKRS